MTTNKATVPGMTQNCPPHSISLDIVRRNKYNIVADASVKLTTKLTNEGIDMALEDKKKHKTRRKRENIEGIVLYVPKGKREEIKAFCKDQDKSMNQMFIQAFEDSYDFHIIDGDHWD